MRIYHDYMEFNSAEDASCSLKDKKPRPKSTLRTDCGKHTVPLGRGVAVDVSAFSTIGGNVR